MAVKTIPWTNGSGNIILDYTGEGDETVTVSSDPNDLKVDRSQVLTFKTSDNSVTRQVTVKQLKKATVIVEGTFSGHPTSYDSDYSAYSVSGLNQGYTDSTSTNYATINLARGSRAVTEFYYLFDTSSIPANATIKSVTCTAKCYISNANNNRVPTRQIQLFSGTTAKGSAHTLSTSTTAFSLTAGTWTRPELEDARIRMYAVRGTSQTTTSIYIRFYGATLTVEYEYEA